jgi:hypothetical protein
MTVALGRRHDNRARSARAMPKVGREPLAVRFTRWVTR